MEIKVDDHTYFGSSVGNAYFSGVSFDQLWQCVLNSNNPKELDSAISAQILLNDLIKRK